MKKYMMMVLVMGLAAFGAFDVRAEVTIEMINAAAEQGEAELMALLPQVEGTGLIDFVKTRIVGLTPVGSKAAKAQELGLTEVQVSFFEMIDAPHRSKRRNDAVLKHLRLGGSYPVAYNHFNAGAATKEECIEAYELMLKNIPLTERTKDSLGRIKGELLKLKDL